MSNTLEDKNNIQMDLDSLEKWQKITDGNLTETKAKFFNKYIEFSGEV